MHTSMRIVLTAATMFSFACASSKPVSKEPEVVSSERSEKTSTPGAIDPNINKRFLDPEIDVDMWAKRWEGESREVFVLRHDILAALKLKPGTRVADVGAGTGLYVKLFSESVGPSGHVFAVDISQPFLNFIKENAARDGLKNVSTTLGANATSNLMDASVDVVFHSDVYHHFEQPDAMIRDLSRVLVAGGEMLVLDFERIEGVTSERKLKHVRASKEVVTAEIEANGFKLIEQIKVPGMTENYLLRFRKE